jgi:hypothetical protein
VITQQQFLDFLADIEPSATTKANASAAHTALRRFLRGDDRFSPYHVETFLSGSYKRNTSIRPRKKGESLTRPDIDIIVVTNHTLLDHPPDVVDLLYWTLRREYPEIRRQARSVGIATTLADMDVVPVIQPGGDGTTMYIPDRKQEKWVVTNPPGHTVWTTQVNERSGGRFKPLVKLNKWWRRENPTVSKRPKGFVLECITEQCFDPNQTQYADLFLGTLEQIVAKYAFDILLKRVPSIADPSVLGNSVTNGMTFDAFEGFYSKAKEHAELGRKAQAEDDADRSLALWRRIFGPRFPASGRSKAAALLNEAVVPGGLTFPDRPVVPRKPGGFA